MEEPFDRQPNKMIGGRKEKKKGTKKSKKKTEKSTAGKVSDGRERENLGEMKDRKGACMLYSRNSQYTHMTKG